MGMLPVKGIERERCRLGFRQRLGVMLIVAMQLSKGASYGIQVTMDRPEPGGSSCAELREGISWGKMQQDAKFVNVICDATIALPLVYAAVK